MAIWNPFMRAKRDSFEKFMEQYDADVARTWKNAAGYSALDGAIGNASPHDRVLIASRLIADGCRPGLEFDSEGANILHVFFQGGSRKYDFEREAPLLRDLLDLGADVNKRSPRYGTPIECLAAIAGSEADIAPFYDVIFSRPDLDFSIVVNDHLGMTLQEKLSKTPRPDIVRRMNEYLAEK